jgi:hypothetical protein
MKGRTVGLILLLVGSVVLGLIAGQMNWTLFRKAIPPTMVSELNQITARGAAYTYGALTALLLFAWGLLVALVAPVFRRKLKSDGAEAPRN